MNGSTTPDRQLRNESPTISNERELSSESPASPLLAMPDGFRELQKCFKEKEEEYLATTRLVRQRVAETEGKMDELYHKRAALLFTVDDKAQRVHDATADYTKLIRELEQFAGIHGTPIYQSNISGNPATGLLSPSSNLSHSLDGGDDGEALELKQAFKRAFELLDARKGKAEKAKDAIAQARMEAELAQVALEHWNTSQEKTKEDLNEAKARLEEVTRQEEAVRRWMKSLLDDCPFKDSRLQSEST